MKHQTLRCLCGLDEGQQTCTEEGELTACRCPKGTSSSSQTGQNPKPKPTTPASTPLNTCGDGHVDPGEACDDGNTDDNDGCSSKCKPDGAPEAADTCPGQAVTLWKGSPVALAGTTEGFAANHPASCYTSLGPDRVYAVQPMADGVMSVAGTFAPGFNAVVEIRTDNCAVGEGAILCEDTISRPFERVVQVQAGHTYFVVVGGDTASNGGAYTLRLDLP